MIKLMILGANSYFLRITYAFYCGFGAPPPGVSSAGTSGHEARARVGAQSGLGPSPGWGPDGPIGPLWAHRALMGPYVPNFAEKIININKICKVIHKNIKVVKLEILK